MSRVGKKPIPVPSGVTINVNADSVDVKGPKGKMRQLLPPGVRFELGDGQLQAQLIREDDRTMSKFHGLARSLVANAVHGVSEGFSKELDIVGIGYRAEVQGKQVVFALGYSHPVVFDVPPGIEIAIDKQTHITVTGIDRQADSGVFGLLKPVDRASFWASPSDEGQDEESASHASAAATAAAHSGHRGATSPRGVPQPREYLSAGH